MASASFDAKDFQVPKYIFQPESAREDIPFPCCPVLVFINSRSGGQLGGDLLQTYSQLLNEFQVFDLGKEAPEKVLQSVFGNLESLKQAGDELAKHIVNNLNLIVAGGDGTASWLLGVVCDLKLHRPPPVATVPLGTGNNLPFAFGWGKKNPGTDRESAMAFLEQVKNAKKMDIDNWHLVMRMKAPKEGSCDPLAPLELPHSLHIFNRISSSDSLNMEGYHTYRGGFWNYFSMGMDAQVSYAFHSERKLRPDKFKSQFVNQSTYLKLGFAQGVFSHDSSGSISQLVEVHVIKKAGEDWTAIKIPDNIKSVICLNLPSFSGGLNPWGTPRPRHKGLTPVYVDDGRMEVVGFKDAWQGLLLLSGGHGTRLAQAHRIRFTFNKGAADHTYMRIDGEPWKQPLPTDKDNDDKVVVEISHHGQVPMLAVPNCRSKGVPKSSYQPVPGSPLTPTTPLDDGDSDDEFGERRKFGAAETFKYPEDIDISHLA